MAELEVPFASSTLGWRHIQTLLLLSGMTIALSLRTCLSVAIVAMRNSTAGSSFPQYDWNQSTSTIILGSFFWGYTVTQFPAGYLVRTGSALKVLVIGICSSSVVNMLIPWLADFGASAVIIARVVMGLGQGCITTCMNTLISRWVPPLERARLGSTVINGMPLGTIVGMSISGLLAGSRFGWPSIFYFFGVIGIVWSILFYCLSADYPSDHSKIGSKELEYINNSLQSLNDSADDKPLDVPWRAILTSVPIWAAITAGCGNTWGFYILLTQLPTYMKYALDYDITESGTVSALPYVAMWLIGFPISFTSDYALRKGVRTAVVRKTCAIIGLWTPAVCMLVLGITTITNKTIIVCILVIAVGFNSASTCSVQINYIDLAPNYVAPVTSVGSGISNFFSLGIPYLIKFFITNPTSIEQWQIVFFVTAGIYFFTNLFFLIYGKFEAQLWNNPENHKLKA